MTCRSRFRLSLSLLIFIALHAYPQTIFDQTFVDRLYRDFGSEAKQRGADLILLLDKLSAVNERQKLEKVNHFFNQIQYVSDKRHWGATDYWATPSEFIGRNAGDCEDYVIAKYFALRELGVDEDKLFLTYVKAVELDVAHMVLTYFKSPQSVPLVLDNYNIQVLPANERRDLLPVYSFNADSFFLTNQTAGVARKLPVDKVNNRRWVELLNQLKEQPRK
jgi:predicted transglutaminase-like cysteine proteinase